MRRHFFCIFFILLGFPGSVLAHLVNQNVGEFYAGMLHPLTSLEHLLPAAALGLFAGRQGLREARWTLLVFPVALLCGTWFGRGITNLQAASHAANLAAIIMLGVLLATYRGMALWTVLVGAGTTGIVLGWRSGIDMANAGVGIQFIPGVGLTGFILVALIASLIADRASNARGMALRTIGGAVVLVGIVLSIKFVMGGEGAVLGVLGLPTEDNLMALVKKGKLSACRSWREPSSRRWPGGRPMPLPRDTAKPSWGPI